MLQTAGPTEDTAAAYAWASMSRASLLCPLAATKVIAACSIALPTADDDMQQAAVQGITLLA